ncbi:MAG: ATP-binding protein, partial [Kiritimatiellae bacterium]|nr:ATP-binding protein [Kiritimatiellia bacterium]
LKGPGLMVDIGTNGGIVLAHAGKIYAASTAAGPAFEGARISCGMRGTHGAIEKVVFNGDVGLEVIGDVAPSGICGSGLIDLLAELLNHGVVTPEGQLLPSGSLPADLAPAHARRVCLDENGNAQFVLVERAAQSGASAIAFTQRDVREVQLGCGAIRAGIGILLRLAGLEVSQLQTVLIAGGFGNFIRRSSAQRIGLLPPGIDHRRIRYVGNVSLAGARCALLSTNARKRGEELARIARHVELSTADGFQDAFADAMMFPDK